ncbi:MAG: peptidoglycan editing factor PgeF [Chloroflexi bacterium]|nr:peptidoglycan editing factor PgeF [Chloroflexota bacterium]
MNRVVHDELIYYQFDDLASAPELYHGVFTRAGGVSRAPFASLNLSRSVGDEAVAVTENNRRMLAVFDMQPDQATTAWLVHGRSVAVVDRADAGHYRTNVDAILTRERGLALTMRFADCVPVVVYDRVRGAIGLAHAGWRGVAVNVVAATLDAMHAAFGSEPRDVWAGIGPCISVDRYRVGEDVITAIAAACPADIPIAQRQTDGSVHLDLNAAVTAQLCAGGVTHIEDSKVCTATRIDEWFSHRAEQGKTGRFGVVIGLQ